MDTTLRDTGPKGAGVRMHMASAQPELLRRIFNPFAAHNAENKHALGDSLGHNRRKWCGK
jgi:hypothetical protein